MKQNTFMDTMEEWHAFVLGWCTAVYPFKTDYLKVTRAKEVIEDEPWYFGFGLTIGIFTWVGIFSIIGGIIWNLSC